MEALRTCRDCGLEAFNEEDLEKFKKGEKYKHGRHALCKECDNSQGREWKKNHREYCRDYNKEWREGNPNYSSEQSKKWRKEHPESCQEHSRQWRIDNPEKFRALNQEYAILDYYENHDGCCLFCFQTDYVTLEKHHPWKKDDPDFEITLCSNHHSYFSRRRWKLLGL